MRSTSQVSNHSQLFIDSNFYSDFYNDFPGDFHAEPRNGEEEDFHADILQHSSSPSSDLVLPPDLHYDGLDFSFKDNNPFKDFKSSSSTSNPFIKEEIPYKDATNPFLKENLNPFLKENHNNPFKESYFDQVSSG